MWKRMLLRMFFPGYGMKGVGWFVNPKKAMYNWIYYRTSISLPRLLGYKPSFGATMAALFVASVFNVAALPVDTVKAAAKSKRIKKNVKERDRDFGKLEKNDRNRNTNKPRNLNVNTSASPVRNSERTAKTKTTTNKTVTSKNTTSKPHAPSSVIPKTNSNSQTSVKKHKDELAGEIQTPAATFHEIPSLDNLKPIATAQKPTEPDENAPKSIPKNACDIYIRKRIVLEELTCDSENVVQQLSVGAHLNIENDAVKNRAKVTFGNEIVGYVSETDSFSIILCLRLGRKIYGVITDVKSVDGNMKMEIELWFAEGNTDI